MTEPQCAALAKDLLELANRFDPKRRTEMLMAAGDELKTNVDDAVRGDIGDLSMSNWTRKKKVEIVGVVMKQSDGSVAIQPARYALGPARVLDRGRLPYAAGARRNSGRYISKRTGLVTQKTRVVKRAGSATAGKGTWGDVEMTLAEDSPKVLEKAVLDQVKDVFP